MKKQILLVSILLILIFPYSIIAQNCPPQPCTHCPPGNVWNMSFFGAVPSDGNSDQDAFECAASCIQANGGFVTLYIDPGVYDVGKQCPLAPWYLQGIDVFRLSNCSNVNIIGAPGGPPVILRFEDCLRFGSFDPTQPGAPRFLPAYPQAGAVGFADCSFGAFIGSCFQFDWCNNISVQNIQTDGNLPNLKIGGAWGQGADGIQMEHDGFSINSCENVRLHNVSANYFGRDGIMITDDVTHTLPMNIIVENSEFNWNGRDGLSWVGGSTVSIYNSKFNNNALGVLTSLQAAGIDLEWQWGMSDVQNGYFDRVECLYNKNWGLSSNSNGAPQCHDFTFANSTFVSSYDGVTPGWAAFPTVASMRFSDCTFAGHVGGGFLGTAAGTNTLFTHCLFTDVFNGQYIYPGSYMADFGMNPPNLTFDRCTFEGHCNTAMTWISFNSIIINCIFNSFSSSPPSNFLGWLCTGNLSGTVNMCNSSTYYSYCGNSIIPNINLTCDCPPAYKDPSTCKWDLFCGPCNTPYSTITGTTCNSGLITMVNSGDKEISTCDCNNQPSPHPRLIAETEVIRNGDFNIFVDSGQNLLTISNSNSPSRYLIMDATGRIVLSGYTTSDQQVISIQNLTPGLYLINIDGKGTKRFIVN